MKQAMQKSLKELEKAIKGFNVEYSRVYMIDHLTDELGALIMRDATKAQIKAKYRELAAVRGR